MLWEPEGVQSKSTHASDGRVETAHAHALLGLWGSLRYQAMLLEQLKWIPGSQIKKCTVGTLWRWQMLSSKGEAMLSDERSGSSKGQQRGEPCKTGWCEGVGVSRPRSGREGEVTKAVSVCHAEYIYCHNSRLANMTLPVLIGPYHRQLGNPVRSILNHVFDLTKAFVGMKERFWTFRSNTGSGL